MEIQEMQCITRRPGVVVSKVCGEGTCVDRQASSRAPLGFCEGKAKKQKEGELQRQHPSPPLCLVARLPSRTHLAKGGGSSKLSRRLKRPLGGVHGTHEGEGVSRGQQEERCVSRSALRHHDVL